MQETDIYVVREDGAYLWDHKANTLTLIVAGDHRAVTGGQPFVSEAPINLVYVSDYSHYRNGSEADMKLYSWTDTGFIAQNVYLFCASEGLACVVRGGSDNEDLERLLKLGADRHVTLKHTIGHPK